MSATAETSPFSARGALALVLFGALTFLALLWMIGAGMTGGSVNDGGSHAAGKGLNGFAALATFLENRGADVRQTRNAAAFGQPGLLVLTPPESAAAADIEDAIGRHSLHGPTLLILPKWQAMKVPAAMLPDDAQPGWVLIGDAAPPGWADQLDLLGELDLRIGEAERPARWRGFGIGGQLPEPQAVQSLSSGRIVPLVRDARGQTLAGYLDDGSANDALAAAADREPERVDGSTVHPVIVVAEPDLLNNYGFSRQENALLALALVEAASGAEDMPISFDLMLNGHGRSANLLTLAFTPPFLAATLCLLMAALAVGWRAFLRFGPPRKTERAIAFGKRALVTNTGGLIRRSRRLHLIAEPYAARTRDRIARALGLPRQADAQATEAAIDRALGARDRDAAPFSQTANRLRIARDPHDLLKAAQDLNALERTLTP